MKISVIVPVYNAEKYVSKCIESVLNQTHTDWELWLVDDGSQDSSLSILNSYAQNDSRIHVIHQENAGAGMARNTAIQKVSGDYIVFIDSDDYVEKNYFELIVQKNTDIVFIDVIQRNENGHVVGKEFLSGYAKYDKDEILRFQMTGHMLWGGVRKAIKTQIVKYNRISFSSHKVGEEAIYSFLILYYSKTYSFIDIPIYNCVVRQDSLSHTLLEDPWGDVAVNLKNKIVELGLYESYASTLNAFFVRATAASLYKLALKLKFSEYRIIAKKRIEKMKTLLDNSYKIDMKHLDRRVQLMYPLIKLNLVSIIYLICFLRQP